MLGHNGEGLLAAKLPRDFAPRRFAQRRAIFAAPPADGIEFCADEHSGFGLGHARDAGLGEQVRHAGQLICGGAVPGQMVKQRQGVRLAAAKLRRQIENGVCFRLLAGQTADDF